MTQVEQLVKRWERIPSIEETGPQKGMNGPIIKKIQTRTRCIYAGLVFVGIILNVLAWCGISVPPLLCGAGLGLLIPGGGLLAFSTWWGILAGVLLVLIWQKWGLKLLGMFGGSAVVFAIWIIGLIPGLFVKTVPHWSMALLAVVCAVLLFGYNERKVRKFYGYLKATREENLKNYEKMLAEYDRYSQPSGKEGTERELSEEDLRGTRYLFDHTVRENGDFHDLNDGLFFPSLGSYRYQFSALSYPLLLLQCKYLPNFRGYLNKALEFCIDGFTDPRTCSYWKWESLLGYLKFNRDPISDSNIMLSGWMLPAVTGYGANNHNRKFEQPDSIRFRPDKNHSYGYDAKGVMEVLYKQWAGKRFPGYLIPCEPDIAFPICNSYGLLGMLMYDRDHGTKYSEDVLPDFYKAMVEEFFEINGTMATCKGYRFGLRFMPDLQLAIVPFGDVALALEFAPIFPGLAKRYYMFSRENAFEIREDGLAYLKGGIPWESLLDMDTKTQNPSAMISSMEMSAKEHGDYELYEALKKTEEKYLERSKNPAVLNYRGVSVVSMANLVFAHIAEKGDWYDTILKGPDETAFSGPVLEDCSYPKVLVAKAVSHGDDLDLVLYNGEESGEQELVLGNLKPSAEYHIAGTEHSFASDAEGTAKIAVYLDGRTNIQIVPGIAENRNT